jgi:general stress protein 26
MLVADDSLVRAFLRRSMVTQVATLSAKGRPFVTPLWFVPHHGTLYITTGPQTWAGRNVQQHPAVTLLFSGERAGRPGQVLHLRGIATCHHGLPSWAVLLRVAAKYYFSLRGLRSELRHARRWHLRSLYYGQAKGGFGYIRVVPNACEFLRRPSHVVGARSC